MSDQLILEIKGLRLESMGGSAIVDNVDVRVNRGQVLGLIGESGAGKSTIGLSSMCYARAGVHIAQGEILIGGVNIRTLDADAAAACAASALPILRKAPQPPSTRPTP